MDNFQLHQQQIEQQMTREIINSGINNQRTAEQFNDYNNYDDDYYKRRSKLQASGYRPNNSGRNLW